MRATEFAVAGGGVAGLTAAVALGRLGFTVTVFEKRAALDRLGAGLQLSPNATRVARALGVLDHLEACATEPRMLRVRRGQDGSEIATIPLGDAVRRRYGAPTLVLHRADLLQVLATAATALDSVDLQFETRLETFDGDHGTGSVVGPTGRKALTAGGLIRAEGLRGSGEAGRAVRYSGKSAWRALIPADALPVAFSLPETGLLLGQDAHIVHYPIRGGSLVNVVVIVAEDRLEAGTADLWAEAGDPAVLRHRLRHWGDAAHRLIDAHDEWRKWPLFEGAADAAWTVGRQTRIGDAAHPMLPFLAQGASQAFEDAAALTEAVVRAGREPAAAFLAFEQLRRKAAERVQAASRRQGRIYHLKGPAALARDLSMCVLGPQRLLSRMDWLYGPVSP